MESLVDKKRQPTWLKWVKSRDAEEVRKALISLRLGYKWVRQDFPKDTSFLDLTQQDVQKGADGFNCRPRASLKLKTFHEIG